MKTRDEWHSSRLDREVALVRWGEVGTPVLLFPTAGGDAEEVERFHLIDSVSELLAEGTIKIYSCDSVAGRTWVNGEGNDRYRSLVQNRFHEYIHKEVVPAIRSDCDGGTIEVVAAGSSIGAYNALAVTCRYPDVFRKALCMSGTYDLERFLDAGLNEDFRISSPLHFLPDLQGEQLDRLRERFVLFASGEGSDEDISESWRIANLLGRKGVPNRVDSWGNNWSHDWPTWRAMLPQYLKELA